MSKEVPKKLYKFYSKWKYVKELICTKKVFFDSAKNFNDVFDSTIANPNELLKFTSAKRKYTNEIIKKIKKEQPEKYWLLKEQLKNSPNLRKFLSNLKPFGEEIINFSINHLLLKLKNNNAVYKISCFSEVDNSLLMWAHYGNKLKGYCIVFDTDLDKEFFKEIKKIRYSNERFKEISEKLYFYKSKVWEYEKEWRLLLRDYSFGYKEGYLSTDSIVGIIVGERNRYKNKVINYAKEQGLNCFIAEADAKEYKINIVEI